MDLELKEWLEERNLYNIESDQFAVNKNTKKLYDHIQLGHVIALDQPSPKEVQEIINEKHKSETKHIVLFTFKPEKPPEKIIDLFSSEFEEWLQKERTYEFHTKSYSDRPPYELRTSLREMILVDKIASLSQYNLLDAYTSMKDNAEIECAYSNRLIWKDEKENLLYLGRTTLSIFKFMNFVKEFNEFFKLENSGQIYICIKNSDDLMLYGFGGLRKNNQRWCEPDSINWCENPLPKSDLHNIRIIENFEPEKIPESTFVLSKHIANAFGLQFPMCYNHDETFGGC